MRPVWLKSRCRIGMKMFAHVYAKPIKRSGANVRNSGKITASLRCHWMKRALRVFCRAFFQDDIDPLRFRRPNAKVRFVRTDQFRSDRISAADVRLSHATLSLINRMLALGFGDFSFLL